MTASNYTYTSLANLGPQGRWRRVLLVAMVPMLVGFIYYTYESAFSPHTAFKPSQYVWLES
jgi:hypothetical protein